MKSTHISNIYLLLKQQTILSRKKMRLFYKIKNKKYKSKQECLSRNELYLLWEKSKSFVFSNAFISFTKHWVKWLASCSKVRRGIAWCCKSSYENLWKTDQNIRMGRHSCVWAITVCCHTPTLLRVATGLMKHAWERNLAASQSESV